MFLLFCLVSSAFALSPGDIAIIGFNFDTSENASFSWVALTNIPPSHEVFFTDNGWMDGEWRANEGIYLWSNSSTLSAGSVVTFSNIRSYDSYTASMGYLYLYDPTFAPKISGDQVLIHDGPPSSPEFMYGVTYYGQGWAENTNDADNSWSSMLPSELEDGYTAISLPNPSRYAAYDMSLTSGTKSELLVSISDPDNWNISTSTIALPPSGTFVVDTGGTLPPPDIDSISPNPVPASTNVLITIEGDDFQYGCVLYFEDTEDYIYTSRVEKLTYVSSDELTYWLNNANDTGTWRVKAKNPDGQESSWFSFTVGSSSPPDIDSVTPDPVSPSTNILITIEGNDFQDGCILYFEDTEDYIYTSKVEKLTYVSSSELTYWLNNNNDSGTWRVKAKNPDGQESSWFSFTVGATISPPDIDSIVPNPVPASTNVLITIEGGYFEDGCVLYFEDTEDYIYTSRVDKLTYVSSSELTYWLNNNNDSGTWRLKVKNPDEQESSWFSFTVGTSVPAPWHL